MIWTHEVRWPTYFSSHQCLTWKFLSFSAKKKNPLSILPRAFEAKLIMEKLSGFLKISLNKISQKNVTSQNLQFCDKAHDRVSKETTNKDMVLKKSAPTQILVQHLPRVCHGRSSSVQCSFQTWSSPSVSPQNGRLALKKMWHHFTKCVK